MGMDPRIQVGSEEWRRQREEQARKLATQRAIDHEQSFNKSQGDSIAKRMGSDLFKGGNV